MPDRRFKFDWTEIQRFYDAGNSLSKCRAEYGFVLRTWQKARWRGDIKIRPLRVATAELLRRSKSRRAIKHRLLFEGILQPVCSRCGISDWNGKPLSIQIDHINGIRDDYRLENLRMLCPNCHSQTPTYGAKNRTRNT